MVTADRTTRRKEYLARLNRLKTERSTWDPLYQSLSRAFLPSTGRFFSTQERNRGNRRPKNDILNNVGTMALNVLAAGMQSGANSRARPWFRLGLADPLLRKRRHVDIWLTDTRDRMMRVFAESNTYRMTHGLYKELGLYGTGAAITLAHPTHVIHHHLLTCGEYYLATNWQGQVVTLYRVFERTVSETVREFGWESCSADVKLRYKNDAHDTPVKIIHLIEPRYDRDPRMLDTLNMEWRSVYFEEAGDHDGVLREGGFPEFPVLAPRWEVHGANVYGDSPCMHALGDTNGLQHKETRLAETVNYQTKPPLQGPPSAKRDLDRTPGGYTPVAGEKDAGIRTLYDVQTRQDLLEGSISKSEQRIERALFSDLFLMLHGMRHDPKATATQIALMHEEKMVILGPVLDGLHEELHGPLIDITFKHMVEAGMIDPPPPELDGAELSVEFISVLDQAQKAIGINALDRLTLHVADLTKITGSPEAVDMLHIDRDVEVYADALGVPPDLIATPEQVQQKRAARAQSAARAEQAALAESQAKTAKDLAAAKTNETNALTDVLNQFSAVGGSPSGSPTLGV